MMAISTLILATLFGTAHSVALIGFFRLIDPTAGQNKRLGVCLAALGVILISVGLQREVYTRLLYEKTCSPDELALMFIFEGAMIVIIIVRKLWSIGVLSFGDRKK